MSQTLHIGYNFYQRLYSDVSKHLMHYASTGEPVFEGACPNCL